MDEDLRNKLDTASLLPRGRWKQLWEAAGAEFALPAQALVDRLLGDQSTSGAADAVAWLSKPEGEPPFASWRAWLGALDDWKKLDGDGGRKELRTRAKATVKAMQTCADAERVMPLLLAGLGPLHWRIANSLSRAKWLEAHPLAQSAAVACLFRTGFEWKEFRDHAFNALADVKGLAVEARGAMWLFTWSDPARIQYDFPRYARLAEPAAIASVLQDSFLMEWQAMPMRPALTRAVCRIIKREDPWLEPKWSEENYEGKPIGSAVLRQALDILPRVAALTGREDLARETLDTCWQSLGIDGAIARGRLGGADAIPALVEALSGELVDRALGALTVLGPAARDSLDAVRASPEGAVRAMALAAIDGSPSTLDALLPICEHVLERATERRSHHEEGLITRDEYARTFDHAADAVRLWAASGFTPERSAMRERLSAMCAEHEAIHDDAAIKRLMS